MTRKFKILTKDVLEGHITGNVYELYHDCGDTIALLTEDKNDHWWYSAEKLQEVFEGNTGNMGLYASVEHFIDNIHHNTTSEVSIRPCLTTIFCNDVEFTCEKPERAVEVMAALLVLFPKE